MNISKEDKLFLYKTMKKIRKFELFINDLSRNNKIFGNIHSSIGQEAVAAGVCYCLDKKDYILSTHRGFGHLIAKGGSVGKIIAEVMGKETGYSKGKGGSMHMVDLGVGMLGTNGIVGAGIPIAVGAAYACKNFEPNRIVVSFFGEGALNTGAFHESLNLASLWKLPIIFICENNLYGISVSVKNSTSVSDLSKRAVSYGINGYEIDGNDVLEVVNIVKKAIKDIQKNNKPSLIICDTYRWLGHTIYDPRIYRTKEEEEKWKNKCPISNFKNKLISENILNSELIKTIDTEIDLDINDGYKFAKNSKDAEITEVFKDVYAS